VLVRPVRHHCGYGVACASCVGYVKCHICGWRIPNAGGYSGCFRTSSGYECVFCIQREGELHAGGTVHLGAAS
jgi:hypothetical protein